MGEPFVRTVVLKRAEVRSFDEYPYSIPAVRSLDELELGPGVTFLAGENGSGKSTLVEAIALAAGFNAEGGTRNMTISTRASHSPLHEQLRLVRGARRPRDGFFLRAESFFNVATHIEQLDDAPGGRVLIDSYGGASLHEQSHGESFLSVIRNRFSADGFYVLDEPEAALSLRGCLALMRAMHDLVSGGSQFVVASIRRSCSPTRAHGCTTCSRMRTRDSGARAPRATGAAIRRAPCLRHPRAGAGSGRPHA